MKLSKLSINMIHFKHQSLKAYLNLIETLKLLWLPTLFAGILILGSYIQLSREVDQYTLNTVKTQGEPVLSIKDYVMNEVRNAGLDEYKAFMVVYNESRFNPEATLVNAGGKNGIDRGLWQINSKYHPEVSNTCAYNYKCSTKEAIRIIKKYGWQEWTAGKQLGLK